MSQIKLTNCGDIEGLKGIDCKSVQENQLAFPKGVLRGQYFRIDFP